jgi:peptidoglycan/xylan/chitin deacetylase (PgdA/CDA1 family)
VNRWQWQNDYGENRKWPLITKRRHANLQILIYHRVNNEEDAMFPALPVATFRRQMEYLAAHLTALSLEEGVGRLRQKDLPDNAVVVTFDDGYRDNYLNAFPILKELSIPATIFLTTGVIGSKSVIWHDRVFSAFRDTRAASLAGVGGTSKIYPLTTLEGKLLAQREFLQFVRSQKDDERLRWIDWLIEKLQVTDRKLVSGLMLSWEEARRMLGDKIAFGSHTVTHPILSRQSKEEIREELWESKQDIESNLGTRVAAFAYPNGNVEDFDESTKEQLREAGYECAVTTCFGSNDCDQDLFELRRATPWDREIYAFALRFNWFKFAS